MRCLGISLQLEAIGLAPTAEGLREAESAALPGLGPCGGTSRVRAVLRAAKGC